MTSHWIRAGPQRTVRRGGTLRLSADSEPGLDDRELELRRGWSRSAGDLRVAVAEQEPAFLAMLPWGGAG